MLALGERIVLRLDDLVPLIQEDVKWAYGSDSPCSGDGKAQTKCTEDSSLKNKYEDLPVRAGAILVLEVNLIYNWCTTSDLIIL